MLALYLDEDSQQGALLQALRLRGFDCLTVNEARTRSTSDGEHLRFAAEQGRILVSRNVRDFQHLHSEAMRAGTGHAGIILVVPQRLPIGVQVACMENIARNIGQVGMRDRLEFLSGHR